jgi:hypothetical protein
MRRNSLIKPSKKVPVEGTFSNEMKGNATANFNQTTAHVSRAPPKGMFAEPFFEAQLC